MKKKQSENYLEYVPQRTPETEFSEDETGIVTLTKEWTGFYNRIAQRFFHRPRVSHIDLDGYGSFIWKLIDGKRTVYDISQKLDEAYPGMEKSLSRLIKFLEICGTTTSSSGKMRGRRQNEPAALSALSPGLHGHYGGGLCLGSLPGPDRGPG